MSILKNAIAALDPAPDKTKQITLLLSLLSELCEQKVNEFSASIENELRTAGSVENKTIPVTEILAKHKEYRAYVSHDAGKIATEVTGAIKKFILGTSDSILDGIGSLVTTGLEAIIGAGSGEQKEFSSYFVVVQSFGLLRFDIRVWSRKIEAVGITTEIEHAFAISAYKSSVDVSKISLNTFLIAYQDQLAKIGVPESEWENYLNTAESVFDRLKGQSQPQKQLSSSTNNKVNSQLPGELYGSIWE